MALAQGGRAPNDSQREEQRPSEKRGGEKRRGEWLCVCEREAGREHKIEIDGGGGGGENKNRKGSLKGVFYTLNC